MKKKIILDKKFATTLYTWIPEKPIAVIQIVHGSAEHASRYDHFATFLMKQRIAVYAIDLRGHGFREYKLNKLGYFGSKNGAENIIDDVHKISLIIKSKFPKIPYFMFGHSMGSFIVRNYITQFKDVEVLIATGTTEKSWWQIILQKILIKLVILFSSKKKVSKLIQKFSYDAFNKDLKKAGILETRSDWVSWNKKNIEEINADSLSGFSMTNKAMLDMLKMIKNQSKYSNLSKIDKKLKILLISGKDDPVGSWGKDVLKAQKKYKKMNLDSSMIIIPKMRHEILNEKNNLYVYKLIIDYLKKYINTKK